MAMREDVYEILPFIMLISNETFESQKLAKLSSLPGGSSELSSFCQEAPTTNKGKIKRTKPENSCRDFQSEVFRSFFYGARRLSTF